MNLPNKLTTLRVVLIPFFVALFLLGYNIPAFVIFVIADLTDFLDGYLARKYNLVTNFGKLMDPLADKLLVTSALILLTANGRIYAPVTIIIVCREFVISGLRQIAAEQGIVLAAGYIGKFKTFFQMIFLGLMMLQLPAVEFIADICMWIALALTIISMVDYIYKNRQVFGGQF